MGIISAGGTDIGKKRSTNQDSIFFDNNRLLFVVADGMGGHNGGDIASQLAVELFPKFFDSNKDQLDPKELLSKSIVHVNQGIYSKAQSEPMLKGMGTTIVSKYFKGGELYIGNVGDSRCYLVNNKKIYQLSKDHSLVQEKLNMGLYTREDANKDKMKNVVVKTVGFEPEVEPDIFTYKVSKNDIFLICSDGLHGKLTDEDIVNTINSFIPEPETTTPEVLQQAVDKLIELANFQGGQDNISVIVTVAQ